jgi:hypothetical protein
LWDAKFVYIVKPEEDSGDESEEVFEEIKDKQDEFAKV